jgi:hypothetical protein
MKRISKRQTTLSILLTILAIATTAHAQSGFFSQIKISFTHQSALLLPSPILTPGPNDGSYMICAYLEQSAADSLGAVLFWTDENDNPRQAVLVAQNSGATSGCTPIRNKANTAPTIATTGAAASAYNIYVDGFGFWTVGPDKQSGITEPIVADYHKGTEKISPTTLLSAQTYDTYLVAATLTPYTGADKLSASIAWTDATGRRSTTLVASSNQEVSQVFLVRTVPNTSITLSMAGTLADLYDLHVHAVKLGTPATGPGPLTFYGRSFLHWVNPITYTNGVFPGMWLMSLNAESTSDTGTLLVNGFPVAFTIEGDADGTGIAASYQSLGNSETFFTRCGVSLTCPLYSAEFDLIVF